MWLADHNQPSCGRQPHDLLGRVAGDQSHPDGDVGMILQPSSQDLPEVGSFDTKPRTIELARHTVCSAHTHTLRYSASAKANARTASAAVSPLRATTIGVLANARRCQTGGTTITGRTALATTADATRGGKSWAGTPYGGGR